jgi:hypothetical protein
MHPFAGASKGPAGHIRRCDIGRAPFSLLD